MAPSLDELIEQRKAQAERRSISQKAYTVARYLGRRDAVGSEYLFSGKTVSILFATTGAGRAVTVHYRSDPVFEIDKGIERYVPGPWERTLNDLYRRAENARKRGITADGPRGSKLNETSERDRRARFGL